MKGRIFFEMATPLWLSQKQGVGDISKTKPLSQTHSLTTSAKAIYSASIEDSATTVCHVDLQLMVLPKSVKTYPVRVIRSNETIINI